MAKPLLLCWVYLPFLHASRVYNEQHIITEKFEIKKNPLFMDEVIEHLTKNIFVYHDCITWAEP